jgi:Flp pilus assembly pilin Flp
VVSQLQRLIGTDAGQDLIEYALLASLIAVTVMGAVMTLGAAVGDYWMSVSSRVPSGS